MVIPMSYRGASLAEHRLALGSIGGTRSRARCNTQELAFYSLGTGQKSAARRRTQLSGGCLGREDGAATIQKAPSRRPDRERGVGGHAGRPEVVMVAHQAEVPRRT